jgi:AraC-like DNA-binding protein
LPCGSEKEIAESGRRNIDRMAPALHYMATHYMEPVRMAVLAKSCFMSMTNFRRLFKQTIKKTPFEYLTHMRIQMAAVLLADTDKTILEISLETGYTTLSSFNRQFKALMGMPPRAWRSKISHSPHNRT